MKNKDVLDYYGATNKKEEEPTVYDDALAKVKRDQNYKSFYNNAIQLYNMKSNAQKYLDNEMASNGLQTQGYGSSAKVGINNQAINLYEKNFKDYNDTEQTITQDAFNRYNDKQVELDNQLVTFLQNDINNEDSDAINKHLTNYGYMQQNEDGSYSYTDKWTNLDADRKAFIKSLIDSSSSKGDTTFYGSNYNYSEDGEVPTYDSSNKLVGTTKGQFNQENKTLNNGIATGTIKRDSFICLKNEHSQYIYIYYGADGNLYYINAKEYNNRANKDNAYFIQGWDNNIYNRKKY